MRAPAIAALSFAALVYPAVWILDSTAVEAWQIEPFEPDIVEINRLLDAPSPSDPDYRRKVAGLYGNAIGEPDRFLFVPPEKYVYPVEIPELRLLPVDKQEGDDPLQAKTVYFFAPWLLGGAGAVGVALLIPWFVRRKPLTPPPPDEKLPP